MILTAVNAASIYRPVKAAGAGATSGIHLIPRLFLVVVVVVVVVVLLMVTDSPPCLGSQSFSTVRPKRKKRKKKMKVTLHRRTVGSCSSSGT